jgi:hypothetical protein
MSVETVCKYVQDLQELKNEWFESDLKVSRSYLNMLKITWEAISNGIYHTDVSEFEKITESIKNLIDQIAKYGDDQ